jgi:hypothetical protein
MPVFFKKKACVYKYAVSRRPLQRYKDVRYVVCGLKLLVDQALSYYKKGRYVVCGLKLLVNQALSY